MVVNRVAQEIDAKLMGRGTFWLGVDASIFFKAACNLPISIRPSCVWDLLWSGLLPTVVSHDIGLLCHLFVW